MTNRSNDLSSNDCYSPPESRLNQKIRCKTTNDGCPVIDECGVICGETENLNIFYEFRSVYENCLKKLEGSADGSVLLKKLAPFRQIVDDLWQQNTLLVEAVEELEQEATSQVTNLQDKLNKSCKKMDEYKRDIKSLIEIIQRLKDTGLFDLSGLKFYTLCPDCLYGNCDFSCCCCKSSCEENLNSEAMNCQDSPEKFIQSHPSVGSLSVCSCDDCNIGFMNRYTGECSKPNENNYADHSANFSSRKKADREFPCD